MTTSTISPLEQARQDRNWTRNRVESLTNGLITTSSLKRWEQGRGYPRAESLEVLCNLFGKTPEELGYERYAIMEITIKNAQSQGVIMSDLIRRAVFGDLSSKLNSLVTTWPHTNTNYQELQTAINQTVATTTDSGTVEGPSRRDALRSVALIALQLSGGQILPARKAEAPTGTILAYCAAGITAAWHLHRQDLTFTADLIGTYTQILSSIIGQSREVHKKAAAGLLAQSLMLKSYLAQHLGSSESAIALMGEAIKYATFAENVPLHAFATRTMSQVYFREKRYKEALNAVQRSASLIVQGDLDPLTQSWIYSGLSYCQAYNGLYEESKESLARAHDFFDGGIQVPAHMLYSQGVLYDCAGITALKNRNYGEAATSFEKEHATLSSTLSLAHIQSRMRRAQVEVLRDDQPRDMDKAADLLTESLVNARLLESQLWQNEAAEIYELFRIAWGDTQRIKQLGREYFGMQREKQRGLVG
jgi:tetratricopeptide (TPR) repeat protein